MIADRRPPAHRGRQRRRISGPFAHDSRTAAPRRRTHRRPLESARDARWRAVGPQSRPSTTVHRRGCRWSPWAVAVAAARFGARLAGRGADSATAAEFTPAQADAITNERKSISPPSTGADHAHEFPAAKIPRRSGSAELALRAVQGRGGDGGR